MTFNTETRKISDIFQRAAEYSIPKIPKELCMEGSELERAIS